MLEEINKEYSKICEYNDDCENKKRILEANTNDLKFIKTGTISIISILPTLIATGNLIAPINGLALPITTAMSISLASSILIWYIGQKIITSVSKRKMKKFTDAKKNQDILEEMMQYEMEIDKSENRKETLRQMYKSIESKKKILKDYPDEFYHIDKYDNLTMEELQKRKEMLTKAYNERLEQLDILTSQRYLNKRGLSISKTNRIENVITGALRISMIFSLFLGIPLALEITKYVNLETFADLIKAVGICFTPTLVVFPLSIPYFTKSNKDIMNAFNNLNLTLGENALSEKPNVEYKQELNDIIATKMFEIVELGIDLKETHHVIEKRKLENTKEPKSEIKKKTFGDLSYNIDQNMQEYPTMFGPEMILLHKMNKRNKFKKKKKDLN